MKPCVITVSPGSSLRPGRLEILRYSSGEAVYAVARRSGKLSVWPMLRRSGRTGNPWSRPLSEENQERLENARRAVYGDPDW